MSRSSFKGISPSGRKYNSTMKTNVSVIKISKTMIAAALFMILTAVKLLLPGQTEAFRSGVREIVNRNYDYGQALETLGERISDGAFIQALGLRGRESGVREADSVPAASYQPVTVNDLRGELTGVLPRDAVHGDYTDKPDAEAENPEDSSGGEAAEETIPAEETVPEVVAAFLETQTEYADYEVPANVSYNIPDLPFAHASPVPSYTSSGFGFRWHPIHEAVKFHYGTDFAAYSGDDIYAFGDGVVSLEGYEAGYGNYIIIDHQDGWKTLYAHCSTVYVSSGQQVAMGDKIALVGDTGEVTGPHLHFELQCNGVYYNPEYYMA